MQHVIIFDKEGWARCGKCRNKLFRCLDNKHPHGIEIKCHSCKAINICEKQECRTCMNYHTGCCVKFESEHFSHEVEQNFSCNEWEARNI